MINIYRLQYENKEAALKDLVEKEVIDKNGKYVKGTEAVVDCGILTIVYATENEAAVIADGYHYNIMTSDTIVFYSEVFPNNPKYKFGGE